MRIIELLDGVYLDKRVGNYWMVQEAWMLYFIRKMEKEYEKLGKDLRKNDVSVETC